MDITWRSRRTFECWRWCLRACVTLVFGGKEKEVIAELTVRCLHRCFGSGDECVVTVYDVRQVSGKYNSDFGVSD